MNDILNVTLTSNFHASCKECGAARDQSVSRMFVDVPQLLVLCLPRAGPKGKIDVSANPLEKLLLVDGNNINNKYVLRQWFLTFLRTRTP